MKKHTILYTLIIVLVIANGYFLFNQFGDKGKRGHRGERKGPIEFIVKKLDFNESQVAQLEKINIVHKEKFEKISKETRALKSQLFNAVFTNDLNKRQLDSLLFQLGDKAMDRDAELFYHFKAIKEICDDTQIEKFEKMLKEVLRKKGRSRGRK